MNRNHRTRAAFTLVELLVVIGIIALLIGILLPVLGRAREAANAVKCAANMRSAVQAVLIYTNEYKGWFPGPHTTGRIWNSSGVDNISPGDVSGARTPVQNMDWASPSLGMLFSLPEDDFERAKALWASELFCPSNGVYFNHLGLSGSGIEPGQFRYASYSAVGQWLGWPEEERTRPPALGGAMGGGTLFDYPSGYAPQIHKVGNASEKVFLVEGARYISGNEVSLNLARYQIQGGNYVIGAPMLAFGGTPYQLPVDDTGSFSGEVNDMARTFAWRHGEKMNLAFLDGHVEMRSVAESIQPALYLPRGSVLRPGAQWSLFDPKAQDGTVIP